MDFELRAKTPTGARLVEKAETLAADFATRATEHDRDASYPFENIEALREAGWFAAPIPERHGGLGVESLHDLLVASSRLARGDASVTIGANMHLAVLLNIVRRWRVAMRKEDGRRAAAFAQTMEAVSYGGTIIAATVSEAGQDLTRPSTVATRTETGWTVNGRKIFATMSPAATLLSTAVSFERDGQDLYGYAQIPADTPGVTVNDDWDALGMRASGSNSVTFDDVHLPPEALRGGFEAGGVTTGWMEPNLVAGPFHAAAALGIAESAHRMAVASLVKRDPRARTGVHTQVETAENVIDLTAMRGAFARAGDLLDQYDVDHPTSDAGVEEMADLFAELQAVKAFINRGAVRVVDRALALSGGAGYMNGHPLSRAYRDVRAGAFMHPLGSNRVHEFIARSALELEPSLA